jgi:hypothetical protein
MLSLSMKLPKPSVLIPLWIALTAAAFLLVNVAVGLIVLIVGGLLIPKSLESAKDQTPPEN